MGKYLITGRQGTGKTTIIRALQEKGYTAYNTDSMPSVTKLQNKKTSKEIDWGNTPVDWSKYDWNWQEDKLRELLDSDKTVFIGAVTTNQEHFYSLFDKIFVLTVSSNTLIERLNAHEHKTHHLPGENERIATDHERKQAEFMKHGIPISAESSVDEIVESILKQI